MRDHIILANNEESRKEGRQEKGRIRENLIPADRGALDWNVITLHSVARPRGSQQVMSSAYQ